jgi:CRP-like cAMP-binding protein
MAGSPWGEAGGREKNFLLAALPNDEYAQLRERLEPVDLELRDVIYEAEKPITHAYFPTTAVLSMISQVDGETAVEVATIGREGMSGLPVFLGVSASPNTVFDQIPGVALRMRAEHLRDVLAGDGALHRQLHRYIQATMVQLSQNVACNRLHSTEERAARWLLMTADRVGADRFPLTQEFLAQMLGVRRATVSLTAGLLHNAGLISYTRGVITIDDRAGLEDAACDCYGIVRGEFEQLAKPA